MKKVGVGKVSVTGFKKMASGRAKPLRQKDDRSLTASVIFPVLVLGNGVTTPRQKKKPKNLSSVTHLSPEPAIVLSSDNLRYVN